LLWEEPFVLDVTIRYWDQARKAGLPVGDDFGEFYRAVEWAALQRHLRLAGVWGETASDKRDTTGPALLAGIRATCNRYIELKPLLRLIERVEGLEAPRGFAFGRI
jgi:aminoglycoside/choline kinase family phosphotransferase